MGQSERPCQPYPKGHGSYGLPPMGSVEQGILRLADLQEWMGWLPDGLAKGSMRVTAGIPGAGSGFFQTLAY